MSQAPLPTCYMSDLFRLHDPGPGHPERPARYDAVAAAVAASGAERREAPPAPREALERVHSPAHIELIERFCAGGGGALDPDTILTEASWEAALRAAGARSRRSRRWPATPAWPRSAAAGRPAITPSRRGRWDSASSTAPRSRPRTRGRR